MSDLAFWQVFLLGMGSAAVTVVELAAFAALWLWWEGRR